MTPGNEIITAASDQLALTNEDPLDLDPMDLVSEIANTPEDFNQPRKYPVWFTHLVHQLSHYRPWRRIIRSDNTIDLEYLAALALQAQQRARTQTPAPQLSLFPDSAIPINPYHPLSDEATSVTANPALSQSSTAPFTVITGANRGSHAHAITLPEDILTIEPGEQLTEFLSRVANAAVTATVIAYGSQEAAADRLGSKAPSYTAAPTKPLLTLAPDPAGKARARKSRS
jgi:hypothetical protein